MIRPALLILLGVVLAGCNPGPDDTADADPPRPVPPQSVSRVDGEAGRDGPPATLFTAESLERGKERFEIFCTPCHGLAGAGDGTAVQRGFPAPPAFDDTQSRKLQPSAIVDVIENGQGVMLSMAERIAPSDRWAIAAYVMTLQGRKASGDARPRP